MSGLPASNAINFSNVANRILNLSKRINELERRRAGFVWRQIRVNGSTIPRSISNSFALLHPELTRQIAHGFIFPSSDRYRNKSRISCRVR